MESPKVYEIKFDDGRNFRVYCANRAQQKRLLSSLVASENVDSGKTRYSINVITTGINTIGQWEEIIKTI